MSQSHDCGSPGRAWVPTCTPSIVDPLIGANHVVPASNTMLTTGSILSRLVLLWSTASLARSLSTSSSSNSADPLTYRYFAYGSNMDPATMQSLRRIQPLSAQAGVLLDYQLRFNVPGVPLLEPSAASVRRHPGQLVHGVIYELYDADLAQVGRTEGVPWTYQWQECQVIPYMGDNYQAGATTVARGEVAPVTCYTLVLSDRNGARRPEHIPPSSSYLRILKNAASNWRMDRSYRLSLAKVKTASRLLVKEGLSGKLLAASKLLNPILGSTRGCKEMRITERDVHAKK